MILEPGIHWSVLDSIPCKVAVGPTSVRVNASARVRATAAATRQGQRWICLMLPPRHPGRSINPGHLPPPTLSGSQSRSNLRQVAAACSRPHHTARSVYIANNARPLARSSAHACTSLFTSRVRSRVQSVQQLCFGFQVVRTSSYGLVTRATRSSAPCRSAAPRPAPPVSSACLRLSRCCVAPRRDCPPRYCT